MPFLLKFHSFVSKCRCINCFILKGGVTSIGLPSTGGLRRLPWTWRPTILPTRTCPTANACCGLGAIRTHACTSLYVNSIKVTFTLFTDTSNRLVRASVSFHKEVSNVCSMYFVYKVARTRCVTLRCLIAFVNSRSRFRMATVFLPLYII